MISEAASEEAVEPKLLPLLDKDKDKDNDNDNEAPSKAILDATPFRVGRPGLGRRVGPRGADGLLPAAIVARQARGPTSPEHVPDVAPVMPSLQGIGRGGMDRGPRDAWIFPEGKAALIRHKPWT